MAPKYKLTYFNTRGLAEFSRLILAYAGVDYEDVRIEREKWAELKPSTPFGHLPVLEVDGVVIAESRAIARFLAKEHGIAGKNNLEAARCDMLVDGLFDLFVHLGKWVLESDPVKKEELGKNFLKVVLPPVLDNYGKLLKENNGSDYFVGGQLTWADIAVAHSIWMLTDIAPSALENHPLLTRFMKKILNIPKIKAWIDKRPVTPM